MVGVTVRCLTERIKLTWAMVALVVLAIIGGNFRSYVVLVGGGLIALSIYSTAGFGGLRLYAIPIVAVLAGTSIFPVYRTLAGIELFYPRVDSLSLAYANYINWQLDDRSRNAVESAVSDPPYCTSSKPKITESLPMTSLKWSTTLKLKASADQRQSRQ
jgi:hypothetical protein